MVRTFICVEITDSDIINQINHELSDFRLEGIKPVKSSQLHLTLKFLGEISNEQVEKVKGVISTIIFSPFTIELSGVGCFPNINYIKVVWIGILEGNEQLKQLAQLTDDKLSSLGFPHEKRPFSPHLTLARVKKVRNPIKEVLKRKIQDSRKKTFGSQYIDTLILKKSTLTPKGPMYEDITRVRLENY